MIQIFPIPRLYSVMRVSLPPSRLVLVLLQRFLGERHGLIILRDHGCEIAACEEPVGNPWRSKPVFKEVGNVDGLDSRWWIGLTEGQQA